MKQGPGALLRQRYRLEGPIGEGGMGTVYLAEDRRLPGRRCAIKAIHPPAGAGAAERDMLRQGVLAEAALLARLDHPALPQVSDSFESDGVAWLVMDYVPGQDLREILNDALARRRMLDEAQVLRWAEEVCAALTYLHRQTPPIIHRDIKPANIKLTPDGQVRLVDFGIAQPVAAGDGRTVTVVSGAGSRPYQPLEQYGDGQHVDARSDVHALGATLYHLLTGRMPPPAQDRFLDASVLEPPRALRPGLAPQVERAILAAMALHPDARPPDAEAFRLMLATPLPLAAGAWATALWANALMIGIVVTLFLAALALTLR